MSWCLPGLLGWWFAGCSVLYGCCFDGWWFAVGCCMVRVCYGVLEVCAVSGLISGCCPFGFAVGFGCVGLRYLGSSLLVC